MKYAQHNQTHTFNEYCQNMQKKKKLIFEPKACDLLYIYISIWCKIEAQNETCKSYNFSALIIKLIIANEKMYIKKKKNCINPIAL